MLLSGDPRGEPGTASEHAHVRQRACSPLSSAWYRLDACGLAFYYHQVLVSPE
jgi:hypothetical protein